MAYPIQIKLFVFEVKSNASKTSDAELIKTVKKGNERLRKRSKSSTNDLAIHD